MSGAGPTGRPLLPVEVRDGIGDFPRRGVPIGKASSGSAKSALSGLPRIPAGAVHAAATPAPASSASGPGPPSEEAGRGRQGNHRGRAGGERHSGHSRESSGPPGNDRPATRRRHRSHHPGRTPWPARTAGIPRAEGPRSQVSFMVKTRHRALLAMRLSAPGVTLWLPGACFWRTTLSQPSGRTGSRGLRRSRELHERARQFNGPEDLPVRNPLQPRIKPRIGDSEWLRK